MNSLLGIVLVLQHSVVVWHRHEIHRSLSCTQRVNTNSSLEEPGKGDATQHCQTGTIDSRHRLRCDAFRGSYIPISVGRISRSARTFEFRFL